jgi:DNA polymerase III delta prime subunit
MASCAFSVYETHQQRIAWLWKDWLAAGELNLIAGTPGTGKTTLALSFAANVSAGNWWPDSTRAPIGNVIIWSGEDDLKKTILPRLIMVPQPDDVIRMASSPRRSISALQTLTFCRAWTSAFLAASGPRVSRAWNSVIDLMSACPSCLILSADFELKERRPGDSMLASSEPP